MKCKLLSSIKTNYFRSSAHNQWRCLIFCMTTEANTARQLAKVSVVVLYCCITWQVRFQFACFLKKSFWTTGLPNWVHSNRPCPLVRPSLCLSHLRLRMGKKFWNFQRQGEWKILRGRVGIFQGGNQIFLYKARGRTHNGNAKIILKIILIQIKSQHKIFECFTLFEANLKPLVTLFTLSNLYAEDFSLHDVAIHRSKICWDQNKESFLRGGTQFLKTQGREN